MSYGDFYGWWAPRKSVAERRADALRLVRDAARRGRPMSPVTVEGRKIATTFWGKAWCDNLERYRDFAYRLDRGRSYVRSGSVVHLAITGGRVKAKVSGSELYDVEIEIDEVEAPAWRAIQRDCAGNIGSMVDLLAGKLSGSVMTRLCAERTGLFPSPSEIGFSCSCPDHARMCKHVAAAMYGVGARFDREPSLLFTLRKVSAEELLASAVTELPTRRASRRSARVLSSGPDLGALFGIELAPGPTSPKSRSKAKTKAKPKAKRVTAR